MILVIDDDDDVGDVLELAMEMCGFRCERARDAAAGLARLRADRPSLVICDVVLRDGNGGDIAGAAAELGIPVLLMSGAPQAIERYADRGIPFLQKPFRLAQLEAAVGQLLSLQH